MTSRKDSSMDSDQQNAPAREAEQDAWIKFGISSERARIVHLFASACGPVDGDGLPLFGDAQLDAIAAHIDPAFARELYALNESNDTHHVGCSSCTASVASDESGRCVPCQQAGPEHGLVLPLGNTPAESCAEASECDRSVTPSREPLLAVRDDVGDIPESSGFQKSETDLDHE